MATHREEIALDRLMDAAETAAFIGRSVRTLEQWRYLGKGPDYVKVGKSIRYRRSAVDRWLDAMTIRPGAA